jgi:hypothetical protein
VNFCNELDFHWHFVGCSHNPTNQKECWITKKNNQNWIKIYVLPFKAMAIMASLSIDLEPLKVNTYGIKHESILQRTIKRTHIIKTHLMGKKLRR